MQVPFQLEEFQFKLVEAAGMLRVVLFGLNGKGNQPDGQSGWNCQNHQYNYGHILHNLPFDGGRGPNPEAGLFIKLI
jgi:hypothetical protein